MIGLPLKGALGPLGVGEARGIPVPAAYWKMDESGSVTRNDSIGTNHLTVLGTVNSTTGLLGNAARFPGSGGNILNCPTSTVLEGGGDLDITWAVWVKLNGKGGDGNVLFKGSSTGSTGFEYRLVYVASSDRWRWTVSRNAALTSVTDGLLGSPVIGTWYLMVCDHNAAANTISMRINDFPSQSAAHGGIGIHTTSANFYVGRTNAGAPLDGEVDELGLWRAVLSDAHVSYLYNGGNGRTYPYT